MWYIFKLDYCNFMSLILSKNPGSLIRSFISSLLLIAVFMTQVFVASPAYAAVVDQPKPDNKPSEVYDLVALIVDTSLDEDLNAYIGMRNKFPDILTASTLGERVIRYADDLVNDNSRTDVRIIFYNPDKDTPETLSNALENLYINGDGNHNNRLSGVVLVGDVPLPVVNKDGNRFVSMFPYTDFEDKAYLYNAETDSFDRNSASVFPKPEIWHGVISFTSEDVEGKEKMAAYFDKNHLYYEEVPEYSKFDRKLFYADLVNEEKSINEGVYEYYVKYLKEWEDLAYMRYNKFWANDLTGNILSDLPINEENPDSAAFADAIKNQPLNAMPDIYAKNVIDQYLIPYYKVLTSHLSEVNDFAENTGRYVAIDGDRQPVDNLPVLISIKDEYTKQYLRNANEAIEKALNEVVSKIEEPLPLVQAAALSGEFTYNGSSEAFEVAIFGSSLPPEFSVGNTVNQIFQRYLYKNEVTGDYYLNGVNADVLDSAKLCVPYLGSTKDEYYDADSNFNPAAAGGDYSILTRSIRADSTTTAIPKHTAGVNTRLLSPEEANKLTNNQANTGAVVEDMPQYGVSAFIDNPFKNKYTNPLEGENALLRGDVIVAVNGKPLNSGYSFDQAIENSFGALKTVIDSVNNGNAASLENYPYKIYVKAPKTLAAGGGISRAIGNIGIEYYRGGKKIERNFTFTVEENGFSSALDPVGKSGGPEVIVLFSNIGFDSGYDIPTQYDFNAGTSGAIFALYDTFGQGFSRNGYDQSAGCNANSTFFGEDRCFYPLATIPVLDPAGSTMFNDQMTILPYPETKDYTDIDEVYYDSCYEGTPSLTNLLFDSNHYQWPIDATSQITPDFEILGDFFGRMADAMGKFIAANGDNVNVIPSRETVWFDLNALDASEIVLNDQGDRIVTLKEFSDRYGMFDGIDNDNDGIRDYEWRDTNSDGVYETKWYDFDEADVSLGIDSQNIGEISRKLMSHNSSYTIPSDLPGNSYGRDVTLNVKVEDYNGKNISSIILHNEPTEHTISEQVKSQGAFSLPIDDPRYVAFMSAPAPLSDYPEPRPVSSEIAVDEILAGLNTEAHYFPGSIEKVEYPNLFEIDNFAQLGVELDQAAWEIAQVYGSYRVLGENTDFVDCRPPLDQGNFESCKVIHDEILNKYLNPSIKALFDDPVEGFDLVRASGEKIVDALNWKEMDIDQKHAYVLERYLSAGENAFVNDATLLPSTPGYEAEFGYEAAYLVLDGEGDHFDMAFNKDLPEEKEPLFNPLILASGVGTGGTIDDGSGITGGGTNGGEAIAGGQVGGETDYEFVPLDEFFQEISNFINGFSDEVEYKNAQDYLAEVAAENENVNGQSALPLAELEIYADKDVYSANGIDKITLTVRGLDKNGDLLGFGAKSELIDLNISQSSETTPFNFNDSPSKALSGGILTYNLSTTDKGGSASIFVKSENGIVSNTIDISSVKKGLVMVGDTSFVADGQSTLKVGAQILNENGNLETGSGKSVRFSILEPQNENMVAFVGANTVQTKLGVAEITLKASTRAGTFKIKTEVLNANGSVDGSYPVVVREMKLVAGEISSVIIEAESSVLVANSESKSTLKIILKDQYGNVANNAYSKIALFVDSELAYFDESADINKNLVGTQIDVFEGESTVELYAKNKTGVFDVIALNLDYDLEEKFLEVGNEYNNIDFTKQIGTLKNFEILKDVNLKLTANNTSIPADGVSTIKIRSELVDPVSGKIIDTYNGPINFKILTPNRGTFTDEPPNKMINGVLHEENVRFGASKLSGKAEILVEIPGFVSETIKINITSGPPASVRIKSSNPVLLSDGDEVVLQAELLDANGNVLVNDNSTVVTFEPTEATAEIIQFTESKSAVALKGIASVVVKGTGKSGTANIIAKSGNLELDTISLKVIKRLNSNDVEDFQPRALYTSLLGGNFGNVMIKNNLAQTILNSGQVQTVTSITAGTDALKRLIYVDALGNIDLLSESVNAQLVLASDSFPYQKVIFSDRLLNEELAEMFVVPNTNSKLILLDAEDEVQPDNAIYVQKVNPGTDVGPGPGGLLYKKVDDEIIASKGGVTIFRVDKFGRVFASNKDVVLSIAKGRSLTIDIEYLGVLTSKVIFNQKSEVKIVKEEGNAYFPGIYLKLNTADSRYATESGFTGSSTANPLGVYVVDTTAQIPFEQAPGISYDSLEEAGKNSGIGFDGENKHMLLFAAGNSVGASNVPYASEVGINFGDPNIRIKPSAIVEMISELSGYGKDIGRSIFTGNDQILEMLKFDYNADGLDDLLLVYENGMVRLLMNENSNIRFRDKGYVLKISGGISSASRIDVNADAYDDLIAGGKLFINNNGKFEEQGLELAVTGSITRMETYDMNLDGCEDLVTSDEGANIRIFYNQNDGNKCLGLERTFGNSFAFGYSIDPDIDMKENLFVQYPGASESENSLSFVVDNTDLSFIPLAEDLRIGLNSSKQAIDVNSGSVAVGDKINYIITLRNNSGSSISGLSLSDLTPLTMTLNKDSLKCLDNNCPDDLRWRQTGMSLRSNIVSNISIPAGGTRTIAYSMTVQVIPEVDFSIGNNFKTSEGANIGPTDSYFDIRVRPSFNPEGALTYIYSTNSVNEKGYVNYSTMVVGRTITENTQAKDAALISQLENYEGGTLSPELQKFLQSSVNDSTNAQSEDKDYDGCVDSWAGGETASFSNMAEGIAQEIEGLASQFRCSGGGCIPTPYNYAFFAPDGSTPGISAIAFGTPNPPGFAPFYPSTGTSSLRFYVSPTLSGGLGSAICFGQYPESFCYAFAIPTDFVGGCPDFLGPINDAVASAKDVTADPDTGLSTIVSDGSASAGTEAVSMGGNYSSPNSPISTATSVNVRIPGFPSVLTNWIDKQTDEIYGKLLDLPDFYFIYPDANSFLSDMAKGFKNVEGELSNISSFQSMNDVLNAINSIPIVQIEGREVMLKVPSISQGELEKFKIQAEAWIRYEEQQLANVQEFWGCDETQTRQTLCDKVTVDMQEMISSVRKLMSKLDQISKLPQQILDWRNVESKYATQIIAYLDAVMQFNGSYFKKQARIVASWEKAVEDVIRTIRDWKLILNVMVDYQESCDECKNDRFSKLGILLNLFVAIPDPPIIPIPKWPDIVFDVSQIRMGTKIIWPDVVFKPEPIVLPDLPAITIPTSLPNAQFPDASINIELEGFDVPDWIDDFPEFVLPELPDLPPLAIPELPDLPRPPKIPQLPNLVADISGSLKPIVQIACLLKKGLVPIPETSLGTEIETLTQPTVQAALPIVKSLGIQMPAIKYDYVKQVRIETKIDLGISTDFIYDAAASGIDVWNEALERLIDNIGKYNGIPFEQQIDDALRKATESTEAIPRTSADALSGTEIEILNNLQSIDDSINEYISNLEIDEEYPETFYLTATQSYIDPSHPLITRSLEEIEADISIEDLPDTPQMRQMAQLRNSMIAYTKNLNETNELLNEIDDYNSFTRVLVENDESVKRFASVISDQNEYTGGSSQVRVGLLGSAAEEILKETAFSGSTGQLIAANIDIPISQALTQTSVSQPAPKGFYIVVNGKNESILNYTEELGTSVNTVFSDVDGDEDTDIVYSMGGDVYLKTNYKNNPDLGQKGDVVVGLLDNSVSDFYNDGGTSVQGVDVPHEGHKQIDISWIIKDKKTVSYEVILKNSLLQTDSDAPYKTTTEDNQVSLEVENGNYYVTVVAIDENGHKSLPSYSVIAAPQASADTDAPFPAVSDVEIDVPIFTSAFIDASNSFDPTGEIVEYYIETLPYESTDKESAKLSKFIWSDTNLTVDTDGDGIASNDKNNSRFYVGPFNKAGDVGIHEVLLHVVDQAGNSSQQKISLNVFVPGISLNPIANGGKIISGNTSPIAPNTPLSLMRTRYLYRVVDGRLKLIPRIDKVITESADKDGKYYTNEAGEYEISDFDLEDLIAVENALGETVAEINPKTGNIGNLAIGHKVVVREAVENISPLTTELLDGNNNVLVQIYVFADANIDVSIFENVKFEASNALTMRGVNISDLVLNDAIELKSLPADHVQYPGGVLIVHQVENKTLGIIDTSGNVTFYDGRLTLRKKDNNVKNDPLVFEVLFGGALSFEIYVDSIRDLNIVGPADVPYFVPQTPLFSIKGVNAGGAPFIDLGSSNTELRNAALDLFQKNVIDGVQTEAGLRLNADEKVTRSEFVKIVLNMLCIVPRPEAYKPYAANEASGGFSDIKYSESELSWYYPYVKEAALLGLVEGYKGDRDPVTGLVSFKPEDPISRAEATKIILKALELREIINLTDVQEGSPWYEQFISVSQELTPYMVDIQSLKNNFVITTEEAALPEAELTRGELILMATRVIDVYNCFEIDKDEDGMSDFCELSYGIDDPLLDQDNDGALNTDECFYGTDPLNPDTDGGGTLDGVEFDIGINPHDPVDDLSGADIKVPIGNGENISRQGESGIFVVPAECNTCPCQVTLLNKADIVSSDILFTVISTFDEKHIFSKSNEKVFTNN